MEKCLVSHDLIITVFCSVDDLWQEMTNGQKIRRIGFAPSLRDSEIIAMEIFKEFQGIETDKGIWSYFRGHWSSLFPQIIRRSTFAPAAAGAFANLWCYKQKMPKILAQRVGGIEDSVHLIDGLPVFVCHYQRAKNCRLFTGSAEFGYCAAKDEKYYGELIHLVISLEGVITGFT